MFIELKNQSHTKLNFNAGAEVASNDDRVMIYEDIAGKIGLLAEIQVTTCGN
jgi:hypothetical protein